MNTFFSIIGIVCVVLAIAGAVVPGFNFHLVVADDKSAQAFHKEASDKLKKRIAAKARAAASQGDRGKAEPQFNCINDTSTRRELRRDELDAGFDSEPSAHPRDPEPRW